MADETNKRPAGSAVHRFHLTSSGETWQCQSEALSKGSKTQMCARQQIRQGWKVAVVARRQVVPEEVMQHQNNRLHVLVG